MHETTTSKQLEAIHAMMARGHRSVRMEPHTLMLWGFAAAALIVFVHGWFTPQRFPVHWLRVLLANLLIAATLTAIGFLDYRWTRRLRRERDEALSFVQIQVTKIWWLLVGLIVLLNAGMNVFGGGYLFYAIALVLTGLAFYVHGLFSQPILSWMGILLIALGAASVAAWLPFASMRWLAVFTFGLGLPVVGAALRYGQLHSTTARRLLFFAGWLMLVITPTFVVHVIDRSGDSMRLPVLSLEDYMRATSAGGSREQVVQLPAGTVIPLDIRINGDALAPDNRGVVPLKLSQPLDIALLNGRPDGRFRIGAGPWMTYLHDHRIMDVRIDSTLSPEDGPRAAVSLRLSTHD